MKRFYFILVVSFVAMSFLSCSKESITKPQNPNVPAQQKDEYYVKYEAKSNTYFHVSVNTDKGVGRAYDRPSQGGVTNYSQIFGPVSYGFHARISISLVYSTDKYSTYIYVSKNNGPFALKASGGLGASYTIDF